MNAFQQQIDGKLALVKITDRGFMLENVVAGQASKDVGYVSINMLDQSLTLINFSVPDGLIWTLPIAFSDDGRYLFEMALSADRKS